MNNKYDIRIRNFSSLDREKVVSAIFDEDEEPSFRMNLYPHGVSGSATEKFVSVLISQHRYYPHSVQGLVESSLVFTVSVVDVRGKEMFISSFAKDVFSLQWMEEPLVADEFGVERFLRRITLLEEAGDLLPENVLTVRVEVSYQMYGSYARKGVDGVTRSADSVHIVKRVPECEPRMRCIDIIRESMLKLHEFFKLYAEVQRLHEVLGSEPELEHVASTGEACVDTLDALFGEMRECFQLHRGLQKEATGILPYSEHMDEDQLKALTARIWANKVNYHRDNVAVGVVLEPFLKQLNAETTLTVLGTEVEWYDLPSVERRMQMLVRLFRLNRNLKQPHQNRKWWDRPSEDEWADERRRWGEMFPDRCMEENMQEMLDIYEHVKRQQQEVELSKEISRFLTLFLTTLEILTKLVFNISEVFFDWTQSVIESNLPQDKTAIRTREHGKAIKNPSKQVDESNDQSQEKSMEHWDFIIETVDGEFHVVPFRTGSTTLGTKLLTMSPVFKSMLSHPMKESLEKKLKLDHFDSTTVTDFLSFVELNRLREDIDMDDCLALYSLAHMYQVNGLMEACAENLYRSLCLQNVHSVRKISLRWGQDHPMQTAVHRFYEDVKTLDDPERGNPLIHEPEFKSTLKEWARAHRSHYGEGNNNFDFYQ